MAVRVKKGFTIIEVTLVLAITMMMFVGLIANTSVNITRQRYNDSVQNFAEFLRREYNEAITVQNPREDEIDSQAPCTTTSGITVGDDSVTADDVQTGRTNCLIYGKLITFGEYSPTEDSFDIIHAYDVIGDVASTRELAEMNSDTTNPYHEIKNELVRSLANVSAGVMTVRKDSNGCSLTLAGNDSTYEMEWGAWPATEDGYQYEGSILIVRSPLSGAMSSFVLDEAIPIQEMLEYYSDGLSGECYSYSYREEHFADESLEAYLADTDNPPRFGRIDENGQVDKDYVEVLCVDSEDRWALDSGRRMIGLARDGYNATAVRVEDQDSEANKCL